jgi:germination protein M
METDVDAIINELIIKLKEGNYKKAKEAVIPSDIEYATYTQEADILTLTFDENYNNLVGIEEVLKRASIVYTMLQIENIDYVRIQVNGQALVIDDKEIGDMSKESFIELVGDGANKIIKEKVKLYYADASGKKLRMLETDIRIDGSKKKEEVVLKKLIEGPKGIEKVGYYASINSEVELKRVAINNKICYVDLNEAFLERRGGVTEEAVVYSVVNTLTELGTVNQVRITINGELVEKYGEHVRLDDLLEKNYDIISYEK